MQEGAPAALTDNSGYFYGTGKSVPSSTNQNEKDGSFAAVEEGHPENSLHFSSHGKRRTTAAGASLRKRGGRKAIAVFYLIRGTKGISTIFKDLTSKCLKKILLRGYDQPDWGGGRNE